MIYTIDNMQPLFEFVDRLQGVKHSEKYHPEGDVLTHSLQVLRIAFRESVDTDLILAAFLHDIGKFENSHGHEQLAVEWLNSYCSVKTLWLIENHMRIHYYLNGTMTKLGKCLELAHHPWLPELIQLARWDKIGRVPGVKLVYDKVVIIERLNKAAQEHFKGE